MLFGTGCYRLVGCRSVVQVYKSISQSDSVIMVQSFYFYIRADGRGKERWL
jgi:hypothetical protein